ncbi:uncharacterized protein KQ657_004359 [Scheffersomyces spartinae]|uniref:PWWP domain-containing protein n=1 Tax=Scheffersomyces spartinae TaxID=45513 RepID=A0A9P7VB52_9ASCO|nr:uncharacterized protein KQ657_004359 [Scheffersomyces spartinae]KAG7194682.1 hypothetical protein KQ657_004359 [Scheffersomyces spartinae]
MLGWPAWPSFVMPTKLIPPAVLKAKKKLTEYCVIFIPDGDFYWMNEKSIEVLSPDKLEKRLLKIKPLAETLGNGSRKKGKKGGLNSNGGSGRTLNVNDALVAAEGLKFEIFMKRLKDRDEGIDDEEEDEEDDDEEEEEEEETADFGEDEDEADLAQVKTEDNEEDGKELANEGDDELDEDLPMDEENINQKRSRNIKDEARNGESSKSNGRQRGRPSRKRSHSPSVINQINEDDESNRKISKRSTRVSRSSSPNTAKGSSSKDMGKLTTNGSLNNGSNDKEQLDERQHQLWLCRIKLQRSLIQRNQANTPPNPRDFPPPSADELSVARLILHKLADIPVTTELLKVTKIHKVLKCILKDEDLEYPDSFKLHEKCQELLTKWQEVIEQIRLEKVQAATSAVNGDPSDTDVAKSTSANNTEKLPSECLAVTETAIGALKTEGEEDGGVQLDDSEVSTINGTEDARKEQ